MGLHCGEYVPKQCTCSNKQNIKGNLQGLPAGIIALRFGTLVSFVFSLMKTGSAILPTGEYVERLKGCLLI